MRMSTSAIVARNVVWSQRAHSEPYEAGWAENAVIFVRALRDAVGTGGRAHVEISPDGMNWVREGTSFDLPTERNAVSFARVTHFGNWLRLAGEFQNDSAVTLLVTLHLKS
ncbi:hypothetical protein [Nitratireductor pacificus]|uniref:Uncharacterized protein n=1 Tax=Nitratireductor pacificus pht-3B TaxID=391937 RepID=K2MBP4_9HYPH|nr:hypothetical protein [Nitratireductor pacificus]EKF18295.1 hypothetical protein NA2_14127 [Nitratireductor pacificus pht-3B]